MSPVATMYDAYAQSKSPMAAERAAAAHWPVLSSDEVPIASGAFTSSRLLHASAVHSVAIDKNAHALCARDAR